MTPRLAADADAGVVLAAAELLTAVASTVAPIHAALKSFHKTVRAAGGRTPHSDHLTDVLAAYIDGVVATIPTDTKE